MSMSTTRISDLPENPSSQTSQNSFQSRNSGDNGRVSNNRSGGSGNENSDLVANTYMPINGHSNPYGIPDSNRDPKFSSRQGDNFDNEQNSVMTRRMEGGGGERNDSPEFRLPSRDIPPGNAGYMHDEEVHANYIPKKKTSDYIRDFEENEEKYIKKHERNKKQTVRVDDFMDLVQVPILISFLFLLFQLEAVNTVIYKYGSFLGIYKSDGNMNIYGTLIKSVLFGSTYFGITEAVQYLSCI